MLGTIVNTTCIIVGSTVGSFLRKGVKEEYQTALYNALGLSSILLGANAFVHHMPDSKYPVLFIVSMALGSVIGYALKLDRKFNLLVEKLKSSSRKDKYVSQQSDSSASKSQPLAEGLSTGILLYCIGTFSMLGPVLSALQGDNTYLFTNATLDLVSSAVLASTYGIGMIWAAPVLFCWQGMFYLIAKMSEDAISPDLICELSIVGGILIAGAGINILKLKEIKTLNMLPALAIPPVFFIIKSIIGIFL